MVACGNELVFGIRYDMIFAAVNKFRREKLRMDLAQIRGMPGMHGGVLYLYENTPGGNSLNLCLHLPT